MRSVHLFGYRDLGTFGRHGIGRVLVATLLLASIVAIGFAEEPRKAARTALDEYVAEPDPAYSWNLVSTLKGQGYTAYIVDLTSQNWRTTKDVDRTLWKHWLTVIRPDRAVEGTALLWIGGGSNKDNAPEKVEERMAQLAVQTGTVVATLGQVPNQPLAFADGKPRVEDDLIAHCWIQYMDSGDPTWLPRLPMVKSAVRAMDTVTALLKDGVPADQRLAIDRFIVAGGSKRGWTTWMTAAADSRVAAIIPIVIDVVNVRPSMVHHFEVYGFWAPAVGDYVANGVTARMDSPEHDAILRIVDPYFYLDRLTMPKYVVNASGDQFFVPDSSQFYYDELKGEKHLRYVENADHSLRDSNAIYGIAAFVQAVAHGKERPSITWEFPTDNSIRVRASAPAKALLWTADNPDARDFRVDTIGKAWKSAPLEAAADGSFEAKVEAPAKGYRAFFIEVMVDNPASKDLPFLYSTPVRVIPDVRPHSIEEYRKTLAK